jgi:ferric-dicitrate binding protein FerR (iron transport regulator)
MPGPLNDLTGLGERVREAQDEALREPGGDQAIREARALWLSPTPASREHAARRARSLAGALAWAGALALVVAVTSASVAFFFGERESPLRFQVGPGESASSPPGGSARAGVPGEWVAASSAERLPLRFSDGSLVRLEPAARARVVDVTDAGGRVMLESGTVHAEIVHRDKTSWRVEAGPFEVRVTGTRFDVGWDPARRSFTLTLLEGSVAVSGCELVHPRVVRAGETFAATCAGEEPSAPASPASTASEPSASTPSANAPSAPSPSAPSAPSASTPSAPSASTPSAPSVATRSPIALPAPPKEVPATAESPRWREALALGRYAEAIDLAESAGLASIAASADVGALMDLANAARFAGKPDRAKPLLLAVRSRFPSDVRAPMAAFHLGRIAFDDEAAYGQAAGWFAQYLTELPGGPLAREASGRRMEALEKSGDHAGAVRAARDYLAQFPGGPHAQVARSIEGR